MAYYNGKEILFSPSISMSIGVVKEYKETNIYNKGDIVSYGGKLYTPKADNVSGVLPTTEATWEELTSGKADKVELEQLQESVERDHNLLDERLANLESGKADKDDFETLQENVESDHNWLIEVDALSITANITSAELADKAIITDGRLADLEQTDIITNKRISNLESATLDFIEDSTIAYSKTVPENALPYAEVTKIGSMTRKCTNLFDAKNISTSTQHATVSLSGDDVVIEGTYYASFSIKLKANVTYSISYSVTREKRVQVNLKYKSGTLSQALTQNQTFIPLEDVDEIYLYSGDGVVAKTTYHNFMLNEGSTALPYEPYFEGLRSAPVSELVSEGVNIWDEEWKLSANGEYITSKNLIPVTPNTKYYTKTPLWFNNGVIFYNKYKQYISTFYPSEYHFTTPSDCYFIEIRFQEGYGKVYNNDVCINKFDEAINGTYFPYFKRTLPIPEAVRPAHGINETVYDYIEWCEDGTRKTRKKRVKCGVVDMGTLDWRVNDETYTNLFFARIPDLAVAPSVEQRNTGLLCERYSLATTTTIASIGDKTMVRQNTYNIVYVKDNDYNNNPDGLKASLSGVMLLYELAEPEVTDISDLLTADNFVEVQAYGSMTPVNEFGYDVPTTINYITNIGG